MPDHTFLIIGGQIVQQSECIVAPILTTNKFA